MSPGTSLTSDTGRSIARTYNNARRRTANSELETAIMETPGKSALGLDGNIAALLGYIIWPVALVCMIIEKENKFVRFHAIQSLLYHPALLVLAILLVVLVIFLGIIGIASSAAGSSAGGAI